jgi:peptidoglycan hydrolase-like protein with peptidoglycan-binding domain
MRTSIALFLFLALVMTGRADDKIAGVQQSLKDQGFYYGEITGEKNADTIAAIRRYQIRNGLQITGDLNEETMRSLKSGAGSASASTTAAPAAVAKATPAVTPRAPSPPPETSSDLREEPTRVPDDNEAPVQRYAAPPPQNRQAPPVYPGRAVPSVRGNFARTPYENAPPEVQQDVIAKVQKRLARNDLYRGEITGVYGQDLEFSLRAYQSRVGLPPTGRLDLETLAALELLPGANGPIYRPQRVLREPPVRGEWIRP